MDINLKNKLNNKLNKLIAYLEQSKESIYTHLTPKDVIKHIKRNRANKKEIEFLLVPTGALQEIAIDNGWGYEFNDLANEIEKLLKNI